MKPGTHWWQSRIQHSRLCWRNCVALAPNTLATVSATKSTKLVTMWTVTSCCRFVAKTGNKVDRIGNKVDHIRDSRLCCRFVAGFSNSQLCRQCVLGSIKINFIMIRTNPLSFKWQLVSHKSSASCIQSSSAGALEPFWCIQWSMCGISSPVEEERLFWSCTCLQEFHCLLTAVHNLDNVET